MSKPPSPRDLLNNEFSLNLGDDESKSDQQSQQSENQQLATATKIKDANPTEIDLNRIGWYPIKLPLPRLPFVSRRAISLAIPYIRIGQSQNSKIFDTIEEMKAVLDAEDKKQIFETAEDWKKKTNHKDLDPRSIEAQAFRKIIDSFEERKARTGVPTGLNFVDHDGRRGFHYQKPSGEDMFIGFEKFGRSRFGGLMIGNGVPVFSKVEISNGDKFTSPKGLASRIWNWRANARVNASDTDTDKAESVEHGHIESLCPAKEDDLDDIENVIKNDSSARMKDVTSLTFKAVIKNILEKGKKEDGAYKSGLRSQVVAMKKTPEKTNDAWTITEVAGGAKDILAEVKKGGKTYKLRESKDGGVVIEGGEQDLQKSLEADLRSYLEKRRVLEWMEESTDYNRNDPKNLHSKVAQCLDNIFYEAGNSSDENGGELIEVSVVDASRDIKYKKRESVALPEDLQVNIAPKKSSDHPAWQYPGFQYKGAKGEILHCGIDNGKFVFSRFRQGQVVEIDHYDFDSKTSSDEKSEFEVLQDILGYKTTKPLERKAITAQQGSTKPSILSNPHSNSQRSKLGEAKEEEAKTGYHPFNLASLQSIAEEDTEEGKAINPPASINNEPHSTRNISIEVGGDPSNQPSTSPTAPRLEKSSISKKPISSREVKAALVVAASKIEDNGIKITQIQMIDIGFLAGCLGGFTKHVNGQEVSQTMLKEVKKYESLAGLEPQKIVKFSTEFKKALGNTSNARLVENFGLLSEEDFKGEFPKLNEAELILNSFKQRRSVGGSIGSL